MDCTRVNGRELPFTTSASWMSQQVLLKISLISLSGFAEKRNEASNMQYHQKYIRILT